MAFGNQFHMPGAYHFEGPGASNTLNANIFRPPASPSSSTYNLAKSTGSLISDTSMATSNTPAPKLGRKRTYDESTYTQRQPILSRMNSACESPMEDSTRASHRYTLAGQIETPGAQVPPKDGMLEDSLYSDVNYRRQLGSKRAHDEGESSSRGLGGLDAEDAGTPVSPRSAGWTTVAFQAIGGVVEKVWEFCKGGAGAFRGFQAGGGKAYEVNGQPVVLTTTTDHHIAQIPAALPELPASPPGAYPTDDVTNFNPGYYGPEHTQGLDQPPPPDTTPERPAAKRRQTGLQYENDELRRNWVMVDDDEPSSTPAMRRPALGTRRSSMASPTSSRIPARSSTMISRPEPSPSSMAPPSPSRRISVPASRFSNQQSNIPTRASSRLSMASNFSTASYAGQAGHAGSPSLTAQEPASFASPRSPLQPSTPTSTPGGSRIPQPNGFGPNPFASLRTASPITRVSPSRPSSRQSVHHPSPLTATFTPNGHRKSNSSVSPTGIGHHSRNISAPVRANEIRASPRLDNEGRHLVTKRLAANKRADSRLDKLNAELQGLIRQGQEALGTSYAVEMDEEWDEA